MERTTGGKKVSWGRSSGGGGAAARRSTAGWRRRSATCAWTAFFAARSTRGPQSTSRLAGSPTRSWATAPASMGRTSGAVWAGRQRRRALEQRWPAETKAERIASATSCSGSADSSATRALRPAVSATRGAMGPSRAARVRLMARAVSEEPVKTTPSTRASATRRGPMVLSGSARCERTWGGTPARRKTSTAWAATSGVCGADLATTALPATRAAATGPAKRARPKFQGLIAAKTPRPR
mmetsp:Transcript_2912/g.9114  ORF Transcript_2912/g.9114 Transcript_2912/m.9114 type:complete len:239 (-) Transcript_2912:141-857(-)